MKKNPDMQSAEKLIVCRNASFAYDGNIVVSGINFTVGNGDYLCIVGENGSGKSTLVKGLLGLKQPVQGFVSIGGGLKSCEIGYLPQQTDIQKDFPASAFEIVLSGRLNQIGARFFYSKADKSAALEIMGRLDILSLRDKCYRELSGGQQQRVLLARALCATSRLLLLDEPVAGLDPVATQELYRQISEINCETGVTVIMVSHDIRSAVRDAGYILHLRNTQVFFGTAADYMKSAEGIGFLGHA